MTRSTNRGIAGKRRVARIITLLAVGALAGGASGCGDASVTPEEVPPESNKPGPGETCSPPESEYVRARFEPAFLVLAPGQQRTVRLVVDPDLCKPTTVTFETTDASVSTAPADGTLQYAVPTLDLTLVGGDVGTTTISASVPTGHSDLVATAALEVDVMEAPEPSCDTADDTAPAMLLAGSAIAAGGSLAGATITLPEGADQPNDNGFQWSVSPFETAIGCAGDISPAGYDAVGPAVRFDPSDRKFPRDMPMSIPLNPARMPETARWRHLGVAYSGPRFLEPRIVPVTNPYIHKVNGVWTLSFKAPRLGTYQAVVHPLAGTGSRTRRLTHRAVVGVSMGGAGTAQFGLRHHHLFDVVAPLGGPVDWTWLIDHIEHNHMAGFRPIAPGTQLADIQLTRTPCSSDAECQPDEMCLGASTADGKCTFMLKPDEPYEHSSVFNNWWYEYPGTGHGGGFDREEYTQIFRDLTLGFGNPVGYNPLALNLPAGVDPNHPAQAGDHPPGECNIYVDPVSGSPNYQDQKDKANSCPAERCSHVQVMDGYYDDEFNPDGTFPVITFCDGAPQVPELTPWANAWGAEGNRFPMEVAVAVDYNGNGVRDELEPVIRSGHETWEDVGTDGLPSEQEPGYGPANLDPSGDDYDPRYNPTGTEGDTRYQVGEPYLDYGLDGVDATSSSPYDFGEGDGEFNASPGLQRFWDYDARSVLRGWPSLASTPLDDEALARLDLWTDGGTRDLFNFSVAAEHFLGAAVARGRRAALYSDTAWMPGLDPTAPDAYNPGRIVWEDMAGVIDFRYGKDEPSEYDIQQGSGQHVGTVAELAKRLQTALYFIGSRWPDANHALVYPSQDNPHPDAPLCEVQGNCTFDFTSSDGRTGPVGVTLPPGYAHADQQQLRYPVIYLLHGYGMTPEDLQAAIVFLANWMNGTTDSQHSRLGKAIVVYVDGRCREQDGKAECIRGSFFADSIREDGPQMDKWWLELMDHVDQRFRTMGETTIEVPD